MCNVQLDFQNKTLAFGNILILKRHVIKFVKRCDLVRFRHKKYLLGLINVRHLRNLHNLRNSPNLNKNN